jgi:hypothetical protein
VENELAAQLIEQLRTINDSLKAIVKRLDRIESTMKTAVGEEELVLLPRPAVTQPAVPPAPGAPPIIESRASETRAN